MRPLASPAHPLPGALLSLLLLLPEAPYAGQVGMPLPSGVEATAAYHRGESGRPAILILHGFLQTRDFPTVQRLAETLAEDGYTVLAPTLSLGIDRRRQSLACEAINTHTMEGSAREVAGWVRWLEAQGHHQILLVGHSSGALVALAYLADRPAESVHGGILISLTYFGPGPANLETPEELARARRLAAAGVRRPETFALAFCRRYVALPQAYLSYTDWDRDHTLERLASTHRPLHLVVGGSDPRIDRHWTRQLRARGARVHVIEGANHFFDAAHEFDLLETVEGLVEALE